MARMEIEPNMNTSNSGRFFQIFAIVSDIRSVKTHLASFFFQNSFDFVSLVIWKQFMHEQGIWIFFSFKTDKENSHETVPLSPNKYRSLLTAVIRSGTTDNYLQLLLHKCCQSFRVSSN